MAAMTLTEILARFLAERDGCDNPSDVTLAAYRIEVESANLPERLYSAVVALDLIGP
jgi:hypothetical protein